MIHSFLKLKLTALNKKVRRNEKPFIKTNGRAKEKHGNADRTRLKELFIKFSFSFSFFLAFDFLLERAAFVNVGPSRLPSYRAHNSFELGPTFLFLFFFFFARRARSGGKSMVAIGGETRN